MTSYLKEFETLKKRNNLLIELLNIIDVFTDKTDLTKCYLLKNISNVLYETESTYKYINFDYL
jgi:hypothetical protein